MRKHIGILMLQFEYLNKQKMPSQEAFLDRLRLFIDSIDRRYVLGLEIRNGNYLIICPPYMIFTINTVSN
jgi:hypothetical protein